MCLPSVRSSEFVQDHGASDLFSSVDLQEGPLLHRGGSSTSQPGLEPLLPVLDVWSPSYEFLAIEA